MLNSAQILVFAALFINAVTASRYQRSNCHLEAGEARRGISPLVDDYAREGVRYFVGEIRRPCFAVRDDGGAFLERDAVYFN